MAYDRVSRETAELVPLPPHTWYVRTVGWLLEQDKVKENIQNVPLNEKLRESLAKDGVKSPILCMPNWYPIAGSQRMRCLQELPALHGQEIRVCRFDKEWWLVFYLWGQTEERDRIVAIYFQMLELVWKSMYYEENGVDSMGIDYKEFEKIGDELDGWKHKEAKDDTL